MLSLPKDVKRYFVIRRTLRLVACVVMIALIVYALIAFGGKDFATATMTPQIIASAILIIAVLYITKAPCIVFDRTWVETIVKIEIIPVYDNGDMVPTKNNRRFPILGTLRDTNRVYIHVNLGGRVKRIAVPVHSDEDRDYVDNYHVGDVVWHVKGSKFLLVLSSKEQKTVRCLACGRENVAEYKTCRKCGRGLVTVDGSTIN